MDLYSASCIPASIENPNYKTKRKEDGFRQPYASRQMVAIGKDFT